MNLQDSADIAFLALTIWREGRGEPEAARRAIADVIVNRVRRPSWWGHDVQSVLFKKWQFSSLTDPKDRQLTTWPATNDEQWRGCLFIAYHAILGPPLSSADSYYDKSIPAPKWATADTFVAAIGRLRFHNLDRDVEVGGDSKTKRYVQ